MRRLLRSLASVVLVLITAASGVRADDTREATDRRESGPAGSKAQSKADPNKAPSKKAPSKKAPSKKAPSKEAPSREAAGEAEETEDGADVRVEGDTKVKALEFSGLDIEGQLKTPQMLYFLQRMRAEFGRPRLPHRSFMPELKRSTRSKAF